MAEKYVLVSELARYLQRERGGLRQRIVDYGIEVKTIRNPDSGQPVLAITAEDARKVIARELPISEVVKPEDLARR